MADDKNRSGLGDADKSNNQDGGVLGNLPPLGDFDSGAFQSDSSLPPLGSFESDSGASAGGLPPLSDFNVETPAPTGGAIKSSPVGFDMGQSEFESPSFSTPMSTPKKSKGFQDPAADSDFSPETPEIGPGPDSDMDTPMYDSAFGVDGGGFAPAFETPAPTQAMETPMFGGVSAPRGGGLENPGFDDGAFMPGGAFEPGGTPAPDFSPDTAIGATMGAAARPPLPPETDAKKKKKKGGDAAGGGKGPSPMKAVLAALICLVVGIVAGPFLSTKVTQIPNPLRAVIAEKQTTIDSLNTKIKKMTDTAGGEDKKIDQKTIDELTQKQADLKASVTELETTQQTKQADLEKTTGQLEQVRTDLEQKNEEFVKTQDAFEDLQNQTAIVQARQMGLAAEVERLTGLVGQLDEANQRSMATTQSLKSSVERLVVQIKEGIPLTPEKYARDARLAAVQDLKTRVELAKWVTPELLNDYTTIYQKELEISASTAYFFARIPVTNNLGVRETKWAECLMKGNWAVYYRTLDGKNIGSYENTAEPGLTPVYAFRETLPEEVQKHINLEISASRGPDAEARLKALAEKQNIMDGNTSSVQRIFNSL